MKLHPAVSLICLFLFVPAAVNAATAPPYDLWTPAVMNQIRDRSTLDVSISQHVTYADVFFTSNPSADWFDATSPYAEHKGEKIRIHAILASPLIGGPYPAIVIGHGHGGHADANLTQLVASLGYVALSIDGPRAGQSTGGPADENQAWISVDKGPQYGYLYHYAWAGMRALTLLEHLATLPANPYRIDTGKFAVIGASMGGILATHMNGIDDRLKSAVIIASAGNWAHTLRYPNSWLYHGIYATRDVPYNGSDPLNSIENIDTDTTTIDFINYFDPIRYAPRQHAPVLTIIGTHDEYFPAPNANLMEQAITSAGTHANFQKRIWLLPNAPHQFEASANLLSLVDGVRQWLNFSFGQRATPLAAPTVSKSGLRFEVSIAEPASRLNGVSVSLYAANRIDTTENPIQDFKKYDAVRSGDTFVVQVPEGDVTSDNAIYYATAVEDGLPVSSLIYKGGIPIDLSTDFTPVIRPYPDNGPVAPVPPAPSYAAERAISSSPVPGGAAYQGMALTNPTDQPMVVNLQAYTAAGRIAAQEGLINPAYLSIPPRQQKIFLAEDWLGEGARHLDGSFRAFWNDASSTSLAFRGNVAPPELDGIGPMDLSGGSLWVPLAREAGGSRRLRVFAGGSAADAQVLFKDGNGSTLSTRSLQVPAFGTSDIPVADAAAGAEIRPGAPVSARVEVAAGKDPWSIDAAPASSGTRFVQPHVELNGVFTTRVLMANTSAAPATATFRLRDRAGHVIGTDVPRTLAPGASLDETAESLFSISSASPPSAGWIEAETPSGGLQISALATDRNSGAAAASAFQTAAAGTWSMPFFVENSGYYTGLALANPGDAATPVTITAYDPSGKVLGSVSTTLDPHASATQLVAQWIPALPAEATGQIVITADAPVALLAYFGTDDGASLAAIPFTP
jgi:dienelactone hydrolase